MIYIFYFSPEYYLYGKNIIVVMFMTLIIYHSYDSSLIINLENEMEEDVGDISKYKKKGKKNLGPTMLESNTGK